MRKVLLIIGCCCAFCSLRAQIACDSVMSVFRQWESRIASLNYEDPELISLHYLFLQDIQKEIHRFQERDLPKLHNCLQMDYYGTKADFQKVQYKANQAEAVLSERKSLVDRIFYERAKVDLAFLDTSNALYNLDRALQFNKYQPEALLLKARLMLKQKSYQESVDLIHLLYTQADLNEEMEMAVSDFTIELYEELYSVGDALVKSGHSAEALEVFLALEQFCTNMPSGYCNDDYYRGILRSREGVYESYLSIAREAERRHNYEMARKFFQYAEEYKKKGEVAE